MLDIKFIRENKKKVKENCQKRQCDVNIDQLLKVDKERRKVIQKIEEIRAEKNKATEEIPKIKGIENLQQEEIISEEKQEFEQKKQIKEITPEDVSLIQNGKNESEEIEKFSSHDEEFENEPEFNEKQENKILDIF